MANELMAQRPYVDAYAALEEGRQRAVARQQQEQANALAQAVQAASAAAVRNGMVDPRIFGESMAQQGFASAIPAAQEALFKTQKGRGEALESMGKGFDQMFAASREQLAQVNNQQGWNAWRSSLESFLPEVVGIVPSEFTPENKTAALQTADMLVPKLELQDIEGGIQAIDPYTGRPVGEPVMKIPLDPEVAEQKRQRAEASAPKMGKEEEEYSKVVGKTAGEKDFAFYDAANLAVDGLTRTNETLDLIESGQPITGAAAELQLNVERLKSAVTGRKNKKIEDTEVLDALLGSDVFAQIQALGIGARGLDTPAEREYLRKVISGTTTLDRNSLRRMAEIRANVQGRLIDRYNQRVERGELDRFFQKSGIPKRKIEKPTRQQSAASPAVTGGGEVTLNIPDRGPVTFPNRQAADAAKEALKARGINVEG